MRLDAENLQYQPFPHLSLAMATRKQTAKPETLKGWAAIAGYLGQPVATVQRWAKQGMPTRREGRYVVSEQNDLNRWLGRESGMAEPAHVPHADEPDLTADLRRGLTAARKEHTGKKRRR